MHTAQAGGEVALRQCLAGCSDAGARASGPARGARNGSRREEFVGGQWGSLNTDFQSTVHPKAGRNTINFRLLTSAKIAPTRGRESSHFPSKRYMSKHCSWTLPFKLQYFRVSKTLQDVSGQLLWKRLDAPLSLTGRCPLGKHQVISLFQFSQPGHAAAMQNVGVSLQMAGSQTVAE